MEMNYRKVTSGIYLKLVTSVQKIIFGYQELWKL